MLTSEFANDPWDDEPDDDEPDDEEWDDEQGHHRLDGASVRFWHWATRYLADHPEIRELGMPPWAGEQ